MKWCLLKFHKLFRLLSRSFFKIRRRFLAILILMAEVLLRFFDFQILFSFWMSEDRSQGRRSSSTLAGAWWAARDFFCRLSFTWTSVSTKYYWVFRLINQALNFLSHYRHFEKLSFPSSVEEFIIQNYWELLKKIFRVPYKNTYSKYKAINKNFIL